MKTKQNQNSGSPKAESNPQSPSSGLDAKAGTPRIYHEIENNEHVIPEESMWVYKSDPGFISKKLILNGEPFLVDLGPRMRKAWDYWDHIPAEDITCCDCADLKDIYFIGLNKTFFVRVSWTEELQLPFPKEIKIDYPDQDPCVNILVQGDIYGSITFDNDEPIDIRGYHFFQTPKEDRAAIQTKRRAAARSKATASHNTHGNGTTSSDTAKYPLELGAFAICDASWEKFIFESDPIHLGGQKVKILKALYDLGSFDENTAKSCKEVLDKAGIKKMSLKGPFSSNDKLKATYVAIYDQCIKRTGGVNREGTGKGMRGSKYYLNVSKSL